MNNHLNEVCGICGTKDNLTPYIVKEMMFGTREPFPYFSCSHCGCLQLKEIPANLAKYYPSNYYSFSITKNGAEKKGIFRWLYGQWIHYLVTNESFAGRIVATIKRKKIRLYEIYRAAGMRTSHKILDIGSGSGNTLYPLAEAGFHLLTGSDGFIEKDIVYDNGLIVRKATLFDISENDWDFIMFQHVFEHLPQQQKHLMYVHTLLKPGGTCLIRIPTVSSYAWEHYRENWVQLDAPRHFFLHSHKSISMLAEQCGFSVVDIFQESTAFQFTGSEAYLRDISLYDIPNELFTAEQLIDFTEKAEQLNLQGKGDSIGVILKKR
jgi:predicted SAM-dependent methyltransferase